MKTGEPKNIRETVKTEEKVKCVEQMNTEEQMQPGEFFFKFFLKFFYFSIFLASLMISSAVF